MITKLHNDILAVRHKYDDVMMKEGATDTVMALDHEILPLVYKQNEQFERGIQEIQHAIETCERFSAKTQDAILKEKMHARTGAFKLALKIIIKIREGLYES